MRTIPSVALLCISLPAFSQTAEETQKWILQETPVIEQDPGYTFDFKTIDNDLFFYVKHIDRLAASTRALGVSAADWTETLIPIQFIEFSIKESRYGYSLVAEVRPNSKYGITRWPEGRWEERKGQSMIYVIRTQNLPKLQKLEKAFKHLIEIKYGRKDLF